ncbi:iron-sulfur cluster assembly protein [Sphaerisporangium sp. NPDC005288]|uniref:iron-sulfur cluster assembly protein n=1 Tax=Sphaerisporangium sp. NPDC005288 TaxID=3155114 RepID=UPI0033A6FE59
MNADRLQDRPPGRLTAQPTDEFTAQRTDEFTAQPTDELTAQPTEEFTTRHTDELTGRLADVVAGVRDPEIDVGLRDLGVLRSVSLTGGRVRVRLAPTRLSCPAVGEIARRVRSALAGAAPGREVEIVWDRGAWQPAAVTAAGRDALRRGGYRVAGAAPRCPYCGCDDVARAGRFGGAVCKVPYDCRGCGSTFDVIGTAGCTAMLPTPGPVRGGS